METIGIEELREKIDRGDTFKLVMTMGSWAFESQHIVGSLNISSLDEAEGVLGLEDEIVVYCSSPACIASQIVYRSLRANGHTNVKRFSGGISEWSAAGYPMEGNDVD